MPSDVDPASRAHACLFGYDPAGPDAAADPSERPAMTELLRTVRARTLADSWEHPGLDCRTKSIATMARLAAMGRQPDELRRHFDAAIRLGIAFEEISRC